MIQFELPVRTVSEANSRDDRWTHARRVKEQKTLAWIVTGKHRLNLTLRKEQPVIVTLTRYGQRKLDTDNLAGSFKAIRDGIANALGRDDGDDSLEWRYEQVATGKRQYSVTVRIEWAVLEEVGE